jgi:hypothetical protein
MDLFFVAAQTASSTRGSNLDTLGVESLSKQPRGKKEINSRKANAD